MANTDWSDLKFVVDLLNHEFKLFNCQQIFVFLQKVLATLTTIYCKN